jgi:hypothetical protein
MNRIIQTLLLAAAVSLTGCIPHDQPDPPVIKASRVFLMYDNIDNAYDNPFTENVNAAGEAVAEGALDPDERVVVFHRNYRVPGETPLYRSVIYELVKDALGEGFNKRMWKIYAEGENASLDTETIAAVVGDVRSLIPADHYGFAFGSHGRGWIPKSNTVRIARQRGGGDTPSGHPFAELLELPEDPQTRFLEGYGQKLDISEFIDALDGEQDDRWKWDFILLDDCFMASVEALYEMRDLADYFIASPTEIMMTGFPYDRVVRRIFEDWSDLAGVGADFVDAYESGEMNVRRSATVSVVKSSELEGLAGAIRNFNLKLNELTSVEGIQYYEGFATPAHVFYDLDDYLNTIRGSVMPAEYNAFRAQLDRTVIFRDHTETFYSAFPTTFGTTIPVTHYSGLNVFIPWSGTSAFISDYRQTEWYRDVYGE